MSIITVPPGDFTPGAQFSIDTIAAVINAAWEQGLTKSAQFEAKVATANGTYLDPDNPPTMTPATVSPIPSVTEPVASLPTSASNVDILNTFDTKYLELVALLSDKFTAFRTAYFPDEQAAYTAAEDWLQAAIANPEAALPAAVASQILADDKDRVLTEAARAVDETLAVFAAKRFPLPPGAAASAVLQIEQGAQKEIAKSSRAIAIKSLELMQFAIEKALALRQVAMGAAVEYVKALASGPDMASRVVGIGYDAESKFISAMASYYNARTEAARLTYSANQHNADLAQDAAKTNLQSELTIIEDKLKSLLAEAQSLASMAAALFNNVRAGSNTAYNVSA